MHTSNNTEVHTEVVSNINTDNHNDDAFGIISDSKVRSRSWFLTINNPTEEEINTMKNEDFVYLIYQHEIGKNCSTPHIHALLYYKNARIWPKKKFPRADIRKPYNLDAVIKYCSKEDTRALGPFEFGIRPEQGRRKDLENLAQKIVSREVSIKELAKEDPVSYIRYFRGLHALDELLYEDRKGFMKVSWFWGGSGSGKTKAAYDIANGSFYTVKNWKWWNSYRQQDVIIFDDFAGIKTEEDFRFFLRLLDRYPFEVETKGGGYIAINSKEIIITCEFPPENYWSENELLQVTRRIAESGGEIRHFTDESNNNEIRLEEISKNVNQIPTINTPTLGVKDKPQPPTLPNIKLSVKPNFSKTRESKDCWDR